MARFQIKLLIFLLTMGFAAGCAAVAIWIYEHQIKLPQDISAELKQMKAKDRRPPDPGLKRFEAAAEQIRSNQVPAGKESLGKLLQQFPGSAACPEAKRIIGEINMDALYSRELEGGKKEYTVQPGDNLNKITAKNQTTFEALARVNALTSINIHLGDKFFIIPMDFELKILTGAKKVWLMRQGTFFKEYEATAINLPPNAKIPATRDGVELELGSKSANLDGKSVSAISSDFLLSEKRMVLVRKGTASSTSPSVYMMVRTEPVAKAVPVSLPVPKAVSPKKGKAEPDEAEPEEESPASKIGIFMSTEDIEEIYPLLKRSSKVNLVQ
jgi:hypothetical protein